MVGFEIVGLVFSAVFAVCLVGCICAALGVLP
jgi:hypothetical protein